MGFVDFHGDSSRSRWTWPTRPLSESCWCCVCESAKKLFMFCLEEVQFHTLEVEKQNYLRVIGFLGQSMLKSWKLAGTWKSNIFIHVYTFPLHFQHSKCRITATTLRLLFKVDAVCRCIIPQPWRTFGGRGRALSNFEGFKGGNDWMGRLTIWLYVLDENSTKRLKKEVIRNPKEFFTDERLWLLRLLHSAAINFHQAASAKRSIPFLPSEASQVNLWALWANFGKLCAGLILSLLCQNIG